MIRKIGLTIMLVIIYPASLFANMNGNDYKEMSQNYKKMFGNIWSNKNLLDWGDE